MALVYPEWELTEYQKQSINRGSIALTHPLNTWEYCFTCCGRSFCSKTKKRIKVKFKRHKLGIEHQITYGDKSQMTNRECPWCGNGTDTTNGTIYVRALIDYRGLQKWINSPICLSCFNWNQRTEEV